ncbi:MAG: hypothetical protein MUF87_19435 [Anaerolineae bacterium]|nr:hypothetical protein [Anaerolineae bacterium]
MLALSPIDQTQNVAPRTDVTLYHLIRCRNGRFKAHKICFDGTCVWNSPRSGLWLRSHRKHNSAAQEITN